MNIADLWGLPQGPPTQQAVPVGPPPAAWTYIDPVTQFVADRNPARGAAALYCVATVPGFQPPSVAPSSAATYVTLTGNIATTSATTPIFVSFTEPSPFGGTPPNPSAIPPVPPTTYSGVTISGVNGSSSANGTWTVTAYGSMCVALNGSVGTSVGTGGTYSYNDTRPPPPSSVVPGVGYGPTLASALAAAQPVAPPTSGLQIEALWEFAANLQKSGLS